jgi:hypothetical protein
MAIILILQIFQFELAREDHNLAAGFTERSEATKW